MTRVTNQGTALALFAIVDDADQITRIVMKNPNQPRVTDVTEEIARLLHHARPSPAKSTQGKGE